ncbi:response regulator transcription factor [Leeuwenhoekiella polynyae]|uniref:Response regulator receiver domain-containing protein n=1 Tax=Leeuwenhoekiella polynyae TaxID=1550906 RepID=A0A4Q0NVR8_9FLAO|nr:response regulator [Leeuwenhoekiella polynyae]RXG15795.1 response regulator receiver domain-containing protein [Leeuwenhoekiella polynyae]
MEKRILVIEDNRQVAEALEYRLSKEGYSVVVCFDGTAAMNKLKTDHFDLVLIDLILPYISGMNIIRWIKTEHSTLPVIVISSIEEETIITHTFLMGVSDFISKPFSPLRLTTSVKNGLLSA